MVQSLIYDDDGWYSIVRRNLSVVDCQGSESIAVGKERPQDLKSREEEAEV